MGTGGNSTVVMGDYHTGNMTDTHGSHTTCLSFLIEIKVG